MFIIEKLIDTDRDIWVTVKRSDGSAYLFNSRSCAEQFTPLCYDDDPTTVRVTPANVGIVGRDLY